MFIRKRLTPTKKHGITEHYQLVETYRAGGRVRQRVIANLGFDSTIGDALARARGYLATTLDYIERIKNGTQYRRRPWGYGERERALSRAYADAAKMRQRIEHLEAVVSEMGPNGDKSDTTPSPKFLEERARGAALLAQIHAAMGMR